MGSSSLPTVILRADSLLESFDLTSRKFRSNATWVLVRSSSDPKVTIKHDSEEPIHLFEGVKNKQTVMGFFEKHQYPLVGKLDSKSLEVYFGSNLGLIWIFLPNATSAEALNTMQSN